MSKIYFISIAMALIVSAKGCTHHGNNQLPQDNGRLSPSQLVKVVGPYNKQDLIEAVRKKIIPIFTGNRSMNPSNGAALASCFITDEGFVTIGGLLFALHNDKRDQMLNHIAQVDPLWKKHGTLSNAFLNDFFERAIERIEGPETVESALQILEKRDQNCLSKIDEALGIYQRVAAYYLLHRDPHLGVFIGSDKNQAEKFLSQRSSSSIGVPIFSSLIEETYVKFMRFSKYHYDSPQNMTKHNSSEKQKSKQDVEKIIDRYKNNCRLGVC
jgi:hypothetical protein